MADQAPKAGSWTRGGAPSRGGGVFEGRGRGRGTRARGRGGAGAPGRVRSSNLSWRAPALTEPKIEAGDVDQQPSSGMDSGMEEEEFEANGEEDERSTPSAFPVFGGAPSAFGTPAFTGGSAAFKADSPFAFPSPFTNSTAPAANGTSTPEEASTPKPRNPAQISTLEVLGEDSDSRKKRFESTLANNRYLELKPLREAQRARDIAAGVIPDPLKPMRLDQATNFIGTCEEMCPEWEREEREYQNNVDLLERYPGTTRIDPARAVKAFHRPAAGNDQPLPSDVRPPHILRKTLDYLFHDLLPTQPLHATHPFLRDRTRSVRQDFTVQNLRDTTTIECNERIARYHILALGTLREQVSFSESQELEQLRKVLTSLNEFYDDARLADPPIPCPNESEFRSYNILTHLRDPDIIWSTELLPPDVFFSSLLQSALTLHALVQRPAKGRGERASPNAFSRFFKHLESTDVPYLFGCILSTHFNEIRKNALDAMRKGYIQGTGSHRIRKLVRVLGCDDEEEVVSICEALGIPVTTDDEGKMVELRNKIIFTSGTIKAKVSQRIVEAKRGSTSYQTVIDGDNYTPRAVTSINPAPPPAPPVTAFPKATLLPAQATKSTFGFPPSSTPSFPSPAITPPTASLQQPSLNPAAASFTPFSFQPTPVTTPASNIPSPAATPSTSVSGPAAPDPEIAKRKNAELALQRKQEAENLRAMAEEEAKEREAIARRKAQAQAQQLREQREQARREEEQRLREEEARRTQLEQERLERETLRRSQRQARAVLVDYLTHSLSDELLRRAVALSTMQVATMTLRDQQLRQATFQHWAASTETSIVKREEAEEKARAFEALVKQIGTGPAWRTIESTASTEEDEDDDDLDGLDVSALSIQVGNEPAFFVSSADTAIAERVSQAQERRQSLWASGTFLEAVAEHVDTAFRSHHPSRRQSWNAVVATDARASPLASWLACKFDVDSSGLAEMDTPSVDIGVQLLADEEEPKTLERTGLIVFSYSGSASLHRAAETRLKKLLERASLESIYDVPLLVIACSDDIASDDSLSKEISELFGRLLSASRSALLLARLHEDDARLRTCLRNLLPEISLRPDRSRLALSQTLLPVIGMWQDAVRGSLVSSSGSNAASLYNILATYTKALDTILREAKKIVIPPHSDITALPLPIETNDLRNTVQSYIERSDFALETDFSLVHEALSARPAVSESELVRLVLDQLAEVVRSMARSLSTHQALLNRSLPSYLASVKSTLQEADKQLRGSSKRDPREPGGRSQGKKRKASVSPTDHGSLKKQAWDIENGKVAIKDKLSDLSQLMKDATALLQARTN